MVEEPDGDLLGAIEIEGGIVLEGRHHRGDQGSEATGHLPTSSSLRGEVHPALRPATGNARGTDRAPVGRPALPGRPAPTLPAMLTLLDVINKGNMWHECLTWLSWFPCHSLLPCLPFPGTSDPLRGYPSPRCASTRRPATTVPPASCTAAASPRPTRPPRPTGPWTRRWPTSAPPGPWPPTRRPQVPSSGSSETCSWSAPTWPRTRVSGRSSSPGSRR